MGNKGQSTVEYIILATAVMAVVLIFFNGQNSGFQTRLNNTFQETAEDITLRSDKLSETHEGEVAKASTHGPTDAMKVNSMGKIF